MLGHVLEKAGTKSAFHFRRSSRGSEAGIPGPPRTQRHPARALSSGSPSAASNPRSLPERPQLSPAPHRWGDRAEKGNDLPRFSRVELGEEARRGGWGHRAFISSSGPSVSGQGRKGGKERSTGTERTRGKQRQGLRLTPSHRRKRFLCVLSSSFFPSLCPNLPRISPTAPAAEVSTPSATGAWHWLPADGGGAGGGARPSRSRARPAPLTTRCASLDQSL